MSAVRILQYIVLTFILIDLILIIKLITGKLKYGKLQSISKDKKNNLFNTILGKSFNSKIRISENDYFTIKENILLEQDKNKRVQKAIDINKIENKYLKEINSIFKIKRISAAVYLGIIGSDSARLTLEKYLLKEKDNVTRLYMANALVDILKKESISVLVTSLLNSSHFYRDRVNALIGRFGEDFNEFLPKIILSNKIEIMELIVDFASVYFSVETKDYLIKLIDKKDDEIKRIRKLYGIRHNRSIKHEENFRVMIYKACDILGKYYPNELDKEKYLLSEDTEISNIATKAISSLSVRKREKEFRLLLKNRETENAAIYSISAIIEKNPRYLNIISKAFSTTNDIQLKRKLAKVLSIKIEYFIMKLSKQNKKYSKEIIKEILYLGRNSEVIDFLNKNKDIDMENELVSIIKEVICNSASMSIEFARYLNERIAIKCGLEPFKEVVAEKIEKKDKKMTVILYILLALCIFFFPVIFYLLRKDVIMDLSFAESIKIYLIDFNYYLAYYSITINFIYLALLVLSSINAKKQVKLWKIKNKSLLFKKKMLPSVSIIAPAYNEEKTIIESANSLLNLKYPDYELVIVNDGSKDKTLEVLIKYFNLTRVNFMFDYKLRTKEVLGIYTNPSIPKLIVVDKKNGGKADSLNTGINISRKQYFCGIDADSLLEEEALLKLASLILDTGIETPALGGNIFPINGCTVEMGQIKNKSIPNNSLARFQTIEYIRAFMAGRLGWAYLRSLLIISGAFGLFRKQRVIDVGGYLTSSGKYEKDTVGEDMELVVRISRYMKEIGKKHKICYGFNANCWTEVPEDFNILKKQRYRWHKGLIDILIFHKKMIFNPRYGRVGIVAMPYFLIFEMLGPLIEVQGYIMVILAMILGLLNMEIALLLFIGTILMGILVSISSLLIAERDIKYFSLKDILILIFYAIIENFGPRQIFSLWRVSGFFQMLKKPGGWDKAERKGFANTEKNTKV